MTKRTSALLLTLTVLLAVFSALGVTADAASEPCISVESGTKTPDENGFIQVSVCFSDNPGFTYAYFQIGWDKSALELQDIRSDMAGVQARLGNNGLMELAPDDDSENVMTSGPLFTLTFKALKDGETTVSLNYKNGRNGKPNHTNLTNCDAEGVDVLFIEGSISVMKPESDEDFDPRLRAVSGKPDAYQITIGENIHAFLTGYQNGKMLFCEPVHLAEGGAAGNGTYELTVPQRGADCVKLLFMDEYWRPLGTWVL